MTTTASFFLWAFLVVAILGVFALVLIARQLRIACLLIADIAAKCGVDVPKVLSNQQEPPGSYVKMEPLWDELKEPRD